MHSNGIDEEDKVIQALPKCEHLFIQGIGQGELELLKHWQSIGEGYRFYKRSRWVQFRKSILRLDHNECVICRIVFHRYRPANTIHHVHHLDEYPELAMNAYDREGYRNLISLCHQCHELVHPEKELKFKIANEEKAFIARMKEEKKEQERKEKEAKKVLTPERW